MDLLQFTRNFDSNGFVKFPGLRFCQNKTYHMAGRMLKRTVVFDTRYNSHDEAHCGILIQGTTHMMKRTVVFWYTVQLTRWSALWYFGTGYNSHDERKGRRSLYISLLKCNLHWLNFCLKWYIICYVHIFGPRTFPHKTCHNIWVSWRAPEHYVEFLPLYRPLILISKFFSNMSHPTSFEQRHGVFDMVCEGLQQKAIAVPIGVKRGTVNDILQRHTKCAVC